MITITDMASEKVKEVLTQNDKADHALRVFVRGMSCSGPAYGMALDKEARPDDMVAELDGIRVLIDPVSAEYMEGAQIDFVDGLTGRGFTILNPKYQQAGGCGGGCSCGH
jgi:iron-sulfur cluster assembly accessory protein